MPTPPPRCPRTPAATASGPAIGAKRYRIPDGWLALADMLRRAPQRWVFADHGLLVVHMPRLQGPEAADQRDIIRLVGRLHGPRGAVTCW